MSEPAGRSTHPLVERFRQGGVPDHLKAAAVRGALPLAPEDLVEILFTLRREPARETQQAIVETMAGLPEGPLLVVARDPGSPPPLLDFLVRAAFRRERVVEQVLLNPSVGDATIRLVAEHGTTNLLDLLALNQVRLTRLPDVVQALLKNPHATPSLRRRLQEIWELHERDAARAPAPEPAAPPAPAAPPTPAAPAPPPPAQGGPEAPAAPEAAAAEMDLSSLGDLEALGDLSSVDQAILDAMRDDEATEEDLRLAQRLLTMTVPEKVQLALKGDRQARSILIRDASKQVQESVIRSPKLTENEVEQFSKMRSISEDLLRFIGSNRDFTKSYAVIHNLVQNPKTPQPVAMQLMQRLQSRDLAMLVKDKNIPDMIRRHARVTLDKRQPKKVNLKKK